MTVNDLILQLEKVDNKEMLITVRVGTHIVDTEDIFEIESGGVNYICIDSVEKCNMLLQNEMREFVTKRTEKYR